VDIVPQVVSLRCGEIDGALPGQIDGESDVSEGRAGVAAPSALADAIRANVAERYRVSQPWTLQLPRATAPRGSPRAVTFLHSGEKRVAQHLSDRKRREISSARPLRTHC
jgi:hypothetical protein